MSVRFAKTTFLIHPRHFNRLFLILIFLWCGVNRDNGIPTQLQQVTAIILSYLLTKQITKDYLLWMDQSIHYNKEGNWLLLQDLLFWDLLPIEVILLGGGVKMQHFCRRSLPFTVAIWGIGTSKMTYSTTIRSSSLMLCSSVYLFPYLI